ncbi:MAG TPA: hypothetical protein PLT68_12235, partial [Actinomycetota bacterium]|nr:hypothetical protein [Actinomycetota bacterium]
MGVIAVAAMTTGGCLVADPVPPGSFVTYDPSYGTDGAGNRHFCTYGSSFNMDALANMQIGGTDSGA